MSTRIAHEILNQIGGTGRLSMMIGAKQFVALDSGVQFGIGSGAKSKINKIVIKLNSMDTYDVEFWKIPRSAARYNRKTGKVTVYEPKMIEEVNDVYNDMLADVIEAATGFYLTLAPRQ